MLICNGRRTLDSVRGRLRKRKKRDVCCLVCLLFEVDIDNRGIVFDVFVFLPVSHHQFLAREVYPE